MIVQCEECKTNFNLDEKRLRGDSAKVRCSKCKHIFMIYKNQEEPAAVTQPVFGEIPPPLVDTASPDMFGAAALDDTGQTLMEESFATSFDSIPSPIDEEPPAEDFTAPATTGEEFSFADMAFSDETPAPAEPAQPTASFDADMLSFADVAPSDEEVAAQTAATASHDLSFSAPDAPEPTTKSTFDFDFSSTEEPAQPTPAEAFDLGGIDFGAPAAADAISQQPAFQIEEPATPTFIPVSAADETAEENQWAIYRPFAIAGACATTVIGLFTAGYFYFKGAPGNLERMGLKDVGAAAEAAKGDFTISNAKAMFVKNKKSGELFVVSGMAVNGYKKPRKAVQVQVTLLDKNGEQIDEQTAYCGRSITEEQYPILSFEKIEGELTREPTNDPEGNPTVAAGKSVACVVVFQDVPANATDFSIEVIASEAASEDEEF